MTLVTAVTWAAGKQRHAMTALVLCREDINPHLLVCITAQHTANTRSGSGCKSRLASSCCCFCDLCWAVCARLCVTALPLEAGGAKNQSPFCRGGREEGSCPMQHPALDLTLVQDGSFLQKCSHYNMIGHYLLTQFPSHECLQTVEVPQCLGDAYRQLAEIRLEEQPRLSGVAFGGHAGCPRISTMMCLWVGKQVIFALLWELNDTIRQFLCMLTTALNT